VKIRFQADADLNQIIVKAVIRQERSIDFQTAAAANLKGKNDAEVLAIAAREKRILVTHDQRTMPGHFASFIMDRASSGVILVSKKMPVAEVVEELILIWDLSDPEEWINRLSNLPIS
jgi:hypothetical protein